MLSVSAWNMYIIYVLMFDFIHDLKAVILILQCLDIG